jgi:PIN domain
MVAVDVRHARHATGAIDAASATARIRNRRGLDDADVPELRREDDRARQQAHSFLGLHQLSEMPRHAADACVRGLIATAREQQLRTNYVLIDFENVHVKSLDLLKGEHFSVMVFLGPKNTKLPVDLVVAMQAFGERAEYVVLQAPGANALDFHVAFHLGQLVAANPTGFFHIISKDTGFDPLVQHLKTRKVLAARSPSIEEMPCFVASCVTKAQSDPSTLPSPTAEALSSFAELWKLALDHLVTSKASKPAKTTTLHSTLHSKLGKSLPASTIDVVCSELVKCGYVKVNGSAVTYALPVART